MDRYQVLLSSLKMQSISELSILTKLSSWIINKQEGNRSLFTTD